LQSSLAVSVVLPPDPELPPLPLPPLPLPPLPGSGVSGSCSDEQAKAPLTIAAIKASFKECIGVPPPRWITSEENGKHPFTETCFTW
jgi:hypothetical protein